MTAFATNVASAPSAGLKPVLTLMRRGVAGTSLAPGKTQFDLLSLHVQPGVLGTTT